MTYVRLSFAYGRVGPALAQTVQRDLRERLTRVLQLDVLRVCQALRHGVQRLGEKKKEGKKRKKEIKG